MSDQFCFQYSIRRINPGRSLADDFTLGPDGGYLVSVLRAAYESAGNLLPPGIFEFQESIALAQLLCGDEIPDLVLQRIHSAEFEGREGKSGIWLCRVSGTEICKLPLHGLTRRIFEALLLVGRQQTSGRKDLLDAALMFVWGLPMIQIDTAIFPS